MKKNIVVLGGGTAGWITAIYAKKIFSEDNVTLIHSQEIGILGAGEGSTPMLIDFFDFIGLPVSDLIKSTKSTVKNGIRFTNWSNDGGFYYHGFETSNPQLNEYKINAMKSLYDFADFPAGEIININNLARTIDYDFVTKISESNRVPFAFNENIFQINNPIYDFNIYSNVSIHFDASKIADFLLNFGKNMGIDVIDGKLERAMSNETGDITNILLEDGKELSVDFIFDCSGFARLLNGRHFNAEWKSLSKSLPMKKAIPFFLDIDKENIPPYTEAIAMEYGWMWKIPLQHRYGCGYVYDSDFISDDDAFTEAQKFIGYEIESPRTFKFDPGFYKDVWINNCLAVGLSSGFVEPLEATSIWQSIGMLKKFFSRKEHIFNKNPEYIKRFNKDAEYTYNDIADFLYLHYMTDKNNNDFWKNFTKNNVMSDQLKEKFFFMQESFLTKAEGKSIFAPLSYYLVANGTNVLNKQNIKNIYESNNLESLSYFQLKQNFVKEVLSDKMVNHSYFLKYLGGLSN